MSAPRTTDDRGGVWIVTALLLGALVYAGVLLMVAAGFSGAVPFAVVPPVLVAMIAANSLLGGGRGGRRRSSTAPGPVETTDGARPDR